jgi:hypothetical protein
MGMATVTLLVTARAGPGGPARIPEQNRAVARSLRRGSASGCFAAGGCGGAERNLQMSCNVNDAETKKTIDMSN